MKLDKLLKRTKKRARKKQIDYDLTIGWLRDKIYNGYCEVTNITFKLYPPNTVTNPFYPSIDRIDSDKGYTKDNCQVVIVGFNNLKGPFSHEALKSFCEGFVKIHEENHK